jgi:hypothetical protein
MIIPLFTDGQWKVDIKKDLQLKELMVAVIMNLQIVCGYRNHYSQEIEEIIKS